MRKLLWMAGLTLALCGCAPTFRVAAPERDQEAKRFKAPKDGSTLYVFRDETMGFAVRMVVTLDGRILGETGAHSFLTAPIAPGVHEVASKTENDERMTFTSEPGKNVYVWQEVKMGVWSARSKLSLVDEPSAMERIKACALHESELPPPAPVAAAPAPVVPGS